MSVRRTDLSHDAAPLAYARTFGGDLTACVSAVLTEPVDEAERTLALTYLAVLASLPAAALLVSISTSICASLMGVRKSRFVADARLDLSRRMAFAERLSAVLGVLVDVDCPFLPVDVDIRQATEALGRLRVQARLATVLTTSIRRGADVATDVHVRLRSFYHVDTRRGLDEVYLARRVALSRAMSRMEGHDAWPPHVSIPFATGEVETAAAVALRSLHVWNSGFR